MILILSLDGFEIATDEETFPSKNHFDKKHMGIFLLHNNSEGLLLNSGCKKTKQKSS